MDHPVLLLDFQDWGVVRIAGPDALEFLQGVGTQDVASFRKDAALPIFFLNDKGRPVALAWGIVDSAEGSATLFVEPGGRDAIGPHLERLRIMEDVAFEGIGVRPRLYGVAGLDRNRIALEWAAPIEGARVIAADPATFVWLPPTAGAAGESGQFATFGAAVATSEEAEAWRIAAGVPRAGVDFDLERIATELSVPEAISLTKGCFVGQEVVARTTHRGSVRRRRVGFRYPGANGVMPRGTELRARGSTVGFVTSTALEPRTGRGLGMGFLSVDAPNDPGEVEAMNNTTTNVEVAPWPL